MPAPPIVIADALVPGRPPAPGPDFTIVRDALVRGLPHRIGLDDRASLAVVLPSGLVTTWRDADPAAVVSESRSHEQAGLPPSGPADLGAGQTDRAPLRLVVLDAGAPVAVIVPAPGLLRRAPDGGPDGAGVIIELQVIGWRLVAGTMRGPGDVGSFLELAWRRADGGSDHFDPPPIHPRVRVRLGAVA